MTRLRCRFNVLDMANAVVTTALVIRGSELWIVLATHVSIEMVSILCGERMRRDETRRD